MNDAWPKSADPTVKTAKVKKQVRRNLNLCSPSDCLLEFVQIAKSLRGGSFPNIKVLSWMAQNIELKGTKKKYYFKWWKPNLPTLELLSSSGTIRLWWLPSPAWTPSAAPTRSSIHRTSRGPPWSVHRTATQSNHQRASTSRPPTTLIMVNEILADRPLDRVERVEKLESMLAIATKEQTSPLLAKRDSKEVSTQTVSTGDIVITKVDSEARQWKSRQNGDCQFGMHRRRSIDWDLFKAGKFQPGVQSEEEIWQFLKVESFILHSVIVILWNHHPPMFSTIQ